VVNILEFYITAGCTLEVAPRNAIQTKVRMEWTLEEFFADGGTTTFMDRVAGALGIHASTIKIVSVYEGSTVLDYAVENDDPAELAALAANQAQAFIDGTMDLGSPVTDVEQAVTSDRTTKPDATIRDTESEDTYRGTLNEDLNAVADDAPEDGANEEPVAIIADGEITRAGYAAIGIYIPDPEEEGADSGENLIVAIVVPAIVILACIVVAAGYYMMGQSVKEQLGKGDRLPDDTLDVRKSVEMSKVNPSFGGVDNVDEVAKIPQLDGNMLFPGRGS
jgi:hypothetical protein